MIKNSIFAFIIVILICFNISFILSAKSDTPKEVDNIGCPVCERIIRAVKDLAKERLTSSSLALELYCSVKELDLEETQFCYNTENVRQTLNRILDLGADEYRVCKKVKKMNPHFCPAKSMKNKNSLLQEEGIIQNERFKRGIIYI